MKIGRVGVLAGGPSNEREISLRSGRAVHNALVAEGIDAFFVDVRDNIYDIIRTEKMDVVFLALHGKFGEDGTVQKMLESGGVPYTGSGPEASRLALDKIAAKEIFDKNGIPIPDYMVLEKGRFDIRQLHTMGLPLVVKPQFEGSSIGLSVVRTREDIRKAFPQKNECRHVQSMTTNIQTMKTGGDVIEPGEAASATVITNGDP